MHLWPACIAVGRNGGVRVVDERDVTTAGCAVLGTSGCAFEIEYDDADVAPLLSAGFGALVVPATTHGGNAIRRYRIERSGPDTEYLIHCSTEESLRTSGPDDLLFHLDKSMTVALQRHRPDLYFLHAATVAVDGRAAVLAAPSGTGKSTLTWALLTRGLTYLSDELAPIDVDTLLVHPYAHALCLKNRPSAPYPLPQDVLKTATRFYVPVDSFAHATWSALARVAAFFFLTRSSNPEKGVRAISPAAAAAHIFANALNPLAHASDGLDAAMALGRMAPCFTLDCGDVAAACDAVEGVLRGASLPA